MGARGKIKVNVGENPPSLALERIESGYRLGFVVGQSLVVLISYNVECRPRVNLNSKVGFRVMTRTERKETGKKNARMCDEKRGSCGKRTAERTRKRIEQSANKTQGVK